MTRPFCFILALASLCVFSACDKDDDDNVKKEPIKKTTVITTDEQALDVAMAIWNLMAKADEAVSEGYTYTGYQVTGASYIDSMMVWGKKVRDNSTNCTITQFDCCYFQKANYGGYTFKGACTYKEHNYHYQSNYKRICQLDKYVDQTGQVYGFEVKGGVYNIDDLITITGSKDNNYSSKRNTDRIPAYFTIVNSLGTVFNVQKEVQTYIY